MARDYVIIKQKMAGTNVCLKKKYKLFIISRTDFITLYMYPHVDSEICLTTLDLKMMEY